MLVMLFELIYLLLIMNYYLTICCLKDSCLISCIINIVYNIFIATTFFDKYVTIYIDIETNEILSKFI